MTRSPNAQLAHQWQERLDRFDECELTVAQFCKLEGYSPASFYQWRRKLAGRKSNAADVSAFVPVEFDATSLQKHQAEGVHLELPGGAQVRIPAGTASPDYRHLIAAVIQATVQQTNAATVEVTW